MLDFIRSKLLCIDMLSDKEVSFEVMHFVIFHYFSELPHLCIRYLAERRITILFDKLRKSWQK